MPRPFIRSEPQVVHPEHDHARSPFRPVERRLPRQRKSEIQSFILGRMSGRHRYLSESFQFFAEMPRLLSNTSRTLR